MSVSLDEVFNKIYKSEQESKTQQENLQKVKILISESERRKKALENDIKQQKAKMCKKMELLSERSVTLNSLLTRQKLLKERNGELKEEKENNEKILKDLKAQLMAMRQNFIKEAAEFNKQFGLGKPSKTETCQLPASTPDTATDNSQGYSDTQTMMDKANCFLKENLSVASTSIKPKEFDFHELDDKDMADTEDWFNDDNNFS